MGMVRRPMPEDGGVRRRTTKPAKQIFSQGLELLRRAGVCAANQEECGE